MIRKPAIIVSLFAALAAGAAVYPIDSCRSARNRVFIDGAEFGGARGGVAEAPGGLALKYDFTGGGAYVGMRPAFPLPDLPEYRITVAADRESSVNYRLTDANGRTFQGVPVTVRPGGDTVLTVSAAGPWSGAWGGREGVSAFTPPAAGLWLTVGKPGAAPFGGMLLVKSLAGVSDTPPEKSLAGKPFRESAIGWSLAGEWLPQYEGAELKLAAVPGENAVPAQLTLVEPRAGRDAATRFRLDPKDGERVLRWKPAFPYGVNPRSVTRIRFRLEAENGSAAEFASSIAGREAASRPDAPENGRGIRSARTGTCVHFNYAPKPEGPFAGWYPRARLLDEIAACGYKYIRDGLSAEERPEGGWKLREHDAETLRAARERGLELIAVIDMSADEPLDRFLERLAAIVRGSRGYVNVYELGNEPHNFGQWRQTFRHKGKDGSWNGYESDGTVSEWVRKHVEYTNAGADLIKKIAPDKTVIGLGSNTPTNFHALNLGVSPQLDGVVDHPYTYSLPPEKVPFGWNLAERDGIRVGDAENTFAGLIGSYREQFRKTGKMRTVWITEFGFTGFWFDGKNETGLYAGFTEEAQAVYLVRRFIEGLALPVAVSCQYDFLDDYGSGEHDAESNFGLLRADYSRKPAFYAVRRMNMLLHNAQPDPAAKVKVTAAPLHRSAQRGELIRDWDKQSIAAENGVRAYAFSDPAAPRERMLAVWSMQPYGREFNNRAVTLEIGGWERFAGLPAAVDLITGDSFGIPFEVKDGRLRIEDLPLKEHPLLITFRE